MATKGLGEVATAAALGGAMEYLKAHRLTAIPSDLRECLAAHVKAAVPKALADAKEAFAAGMPEVAEQTFAATMVLAGIEAAKEAGYPPAAFKSGGMTCAEAAGALAH